jgi:hypothetical protein
MKAFYKGQAIEPYESFYHNTSLQFFRGQLGGGQSRCVKCDDSLAVMEVVYEQDSDSRILLEESAERSSL